MLAEKNYSDDWSLSVCFGGSKRYGDNCKIMGFEEWPHTARDIEERRH